MVEGKNEAAKAAILTIIIVTSGLLAFSFETTQVEAKTIRIACVGDSITERSGYPAALQQMLGENYTVENFGVAGSTVSRDSKIPYMAQDAFKRALNFHPDIVVIMLGTNDANPEITYNESCFEADYTQLINSFVTLEGEQYIIIVKSPPIVSIKSPYNGTYLSSTVLSHVDNVANSLALPKVDVYDAFQNNPDYFYGDGYGDGVHPNHEGTAIICSSIYDAITLSDGSPDYDYLVDGISG